MMNSRRLLLLASAFAFTLATAACGEAGADSGWTTTVDTLPGGIRHVVNAPPAAGAGPTPLLEEELRIGTVEGAGPESFGQLKALVVDDDGRMIVLDAQPQEIRVFAPDGAHVATYGGRGGGPGEFENALGIMQGPEGRLWVPDQRNARMSVMDADSGFITSYPLTLYRWGFVWNGVMRDDGHIIVPSMSPVTRRDLMRVYDLEMTEVDSILLPERPAVDQQNPPNAFVWQAPGGLPRGVAGVPFYPSGAQTLDSSGDFWSAGHGDPSYRIARSSMRGDTTLVIETRRAAVPVTAAERDSAMSGLLESLSRYGVTELDASKVPAVKPAVAAMFRSDDDRLWVQTSSPDTLRRYDVYEADGTYAGSFGTGLAVVSYIPPVVREGHFYAIVTDDLGVQYIIRAPLESGGGGAE